MSNSLESQSASTEWRSDYQIGLDEGRRELQTRITETEAQLADAQKDAARLDALWADATLRRLDLISAAESLINNADECEGDGGEQVFSVSAQYITDLQDAVSAEPDILDMPINCAMQPKEQST